MTVGSSALTDRQAQALTRFTAALVVLGAAAVSAGARSFTTIGLFGGWFLAGALATYAGIGAIAVARIARFHPHARLGAANAVTLVRAIMASFFAGLALQSAIEPVVVAPPAAWFLAALGFLAIALDGIDGWLARRQGLESPFGSRFDMEIDALQILLLSILALTFDKAGGWVLIGGLLRYIFVAAGWVWPALAAPLPPSWRRKVVCVIQGGALVVLLAPAVVPPFGTAIGAIALALLVMSFGQDVLWSLRSATLRHSQR